MSTTKKMRIDRTIYMVQCKHHSDTFIMMAHSYHKMEHSIKFCEKIKYDNRYN